jgi:hypothetical protein
VDLCPYLKDCVGIGLCLSPSFCARDAVGLFERLVKEFKIPYRRGQFNEYLNRQYRRPPDIKNKLEHWLGRPPAEAQQVERWTGTRWIPDDGKPGLAFSGVVFDGGLRCKIPTPKTWTSDCDCHLISDNRCPSGIAARHTVKRFSCSNGCIMTRTHLRLVAKSNSVVA